MDIKYITFGSGPKTMVILPGLSLRPVSETPQAVINAYEIFATDYTVYLFDYKEDPEEGLKIEDMAEDVAQAIEEMELKDIYLYGVSMGGMVAQCLTLNHPDLVKKLVLCSTVSKVDPERKTSVWLKYAEEKDIMRLIDAFMKDVYTKELYEQFIDMMISMYKSLTDEELKAFTIRLEACQGFDIMERLGEIKIPVLVLGSRCDQVFTVEEMGETARILKCESYFYDGYSHAVYDEAEDIKDRINEFFMR